MKRSPLIFIVLIIALYTSPLFSQTEKEISIAHLKSNMEFLADDLLEGRNSTSRGERIASLYIAKELQKYGVQPFGDSGTYYQPFNLNIEGFTAGSGLTVISSEEDKFFENGGNIVYYNWAELPDTSYAGITADIVFAGYGITAEEFEYDDYKDLDVKGKFVLALAGMPEGENYFDPVKDKNYSSPTYKRNLAKEKGAVGILAVAHGDWSKYWHWLKRSANRKIYSLINDDEDKNGSIPIVALDESASHYLFSNEVLEFDSIKSLIDTGQVPAGFNLNKKINLNYGIEHEVKSTRNVIGILPGNDDELQEEYVTFGAHYDHVGISGDNIYNGADDNASGTVAVLEAARQLSLEGDNDRPIIFAFYSSEEKGLLGSEYMADNVDWINDAIVNINLDMVGRESSDSIYVIGSDRLSSKLYEIVEEENADGEYFILDYTFNDPDDPNRFYWRSDHVQYVKKNIPIVFFFDYMKTDYHKPTDTAEKINFEKLFKISSLAADIAETISTMNKKLVVDKLTAN